jgi:hypothetical protein
MSDYAMFGPARHAQTRDDRVGYAASDDPVNTGVIDQLLGGVSRLYPVPARGVGALLVAGVVLGVLGDLLLRAPGPVGLNVSLWIASVAAAGFGLHYRAALALERERAAWLLIGVVFAAGFAWRDAPSLKLLALACATLTFALAAHGVSAAWVRQAGVLRYGAALALGAMHAWAAPPLAVADATRAAPRAGSRRAAGWRRTAAVARGLLIAIPLVAVFGALFMSADAVFATLVTNVFRFDFEWLAGHILLFSILAWLSTGYLRGFLTGTEPPLRGLWRDGARLGLMPKRPTIGMTETATALAALNLLFLVFVVVQFRYLFAGDTLVQVTPDLTYAEYARRGFFELVVAAFLVVPVLLAADWLLERRSAGNDFVFPSLAGVQIGLVLAIAASAFQRLRLYHASYGLTESRFYAMVLLIWIAGILLWLAATVLRGRRDSFAFGALIAGLSAVMLLFVVNPDAIVARTNVVRMSSPDASVRFDAAYATSLSADAVPVLIEALPALPRDVQCRLARHMLRRWPPGGERSLRNWNWSAARASDAVREHEAALQSMVGPADGCAPPDRPRPDGS